jgi:hypothetical protein
MGLCLANMVGAEIWRRNASQISTSHWIHYDALSCPCASENLTLASIDEHSGLPFSDPKNLIHELLLIAFMTLG